MTIGGYSMNGYCGILSMDIGDYSINDYWWLFYEWLLWLFY
jgi:hypothetical protein